MSFLEVLTILLCLLVLMYWFSAMHAKELARLAGRQACQRQQLEFLDDTVVLQKVRLRRNRIGQMAVWRSFDFEFTSDGSCRYSGNIDMLGKVVQSVSLEVHRLPPVAG